MKKIHIGLIDDDVDIIQALKLSLTSRDIDVDAYHCASKRMAKEIVDKLLNQRPPDALLIDINMPITGDHIASVLRGAKQYKDIPFIFVSAYFISKSDSKSNNEKKEYYLSRPIKPDDLCCVIRNAVSNIY